MVPVIWEQLPKGVNRTALRSPTLVQSPDNHARLCHPNTVENTRAAFAKKNT
jgi:hypothetical protein